jgi:hypothetical protein
LASFTPSTAEELAEVVRTSDRLPVPLLEPGEGLSFAQLRGDIRHDVADGVVSCLAGTTLRELNEALAKDARCIPHASVWPDDAEEMPLAVLILLGLPHAAEASRGSWKDWILGATMVTAEGTLVKSGSRVVKSVAGYDAHKLLVGSRGALILPTEIALRTFHISAASFPHPVQRLGDKVRSILRVRPTDMCIALDALGDEALLNDSATGTVWCSRSVQDLPTIPFSWSMDPLLPTIEEKTLTLQRRAKTVLDPTGKLAPGAFSNV